MGKTAIRVHDRARREWRARLQAAVDAAKVQRGRGRWPPSLQVVVGAVGTITIELDGWELHELYTILVDSDGPEGCCAGCTKLPKGWCRTCDEQ